jgi:hypothetical protein
VIQLVPALAESTTAESPPTDHAPADPAPAASPPADPALTESSTEPIHSAAGDAPTDTSSLYNLII